MSDERSSCPHCGAPGTPHPPRFSCRTQRVDGGLRVSEECRLRRERDEARRALRLCVSVQEAAHEDEAKLRDENESMRRERDEARAWAEECETARDAEHTYASIVKAENESMRRVVQEAADARWMNATDWHSMKNAVSEYRKGQQDA